MVVVILNHKIKEIVLWPVFYVWDRIKKGDQSSARSGHLLAKHLFDSACSGQYFMSEIELKTGSKGDA